MSDAGERALGERLARLEAEMRDLRRDVREINVSLNGPPREESFRGRLHVLETSNAAARAAEAALTAARAIERDSWTIPQKSLVTGAALIGAAAAIYNALGG